MSGLAGLLAGHDAPAVYRWVATYPPEDVRRAVETAGWDLAYVDGWHATDKAGVLRGLGEALDFPDYYGRNLDALADCLADLPRDTVLLWDGWSTLARAEPKAFDAVLQVLDERSRGTGPRFAVLLRGDGPELPVIPLLD